MSFATGRAVATVVNPDGPRRRDNREFRASSARDDDADRRWKRRAGGGTESSRLSAVLEVLAGTGDRTRKGRHPKMAAFLKTRRYLVSIPSKQVAGAGFERTAYSRLKSAIAAERDAPDDAPGIDSIMDSDSIPGLLKQVMLAASSLDDDRLLELLEVAERLQIDAEAERTSRESLQPAPTRQASSQSGC